MAEQMVKAQLFVEIQARKIAEAKHELEKQDAWCKKNYWFIKRERAIALWLDEETLSDNEY